MSSDNFELHWSRPPRFCPYCGCNAIVAVGKWSADSKEDKGLTATLEEYQCEAACEGRSFWS